MYGLNDYYLKLPTYTGKVRVYDCASIYDEPDINSRIKGKACSGKVKIMWKENVKWYYVNDGTTNEEVLEMLIDRMKYLQAKFPCKENACVITKLEESLMWLEKRTNDRKKRNVEGKHVI